MKIKTITYQRVKNLGNYESERIELSAELNDDDDVQKTINQLKNKAFEALNIQENENPFQ